MSTRRALLALLIGLAFAGCAQAAPARIVTADRHPSPGANDACYLMGFTYRLVTDPMYGTAVKEEGGPYAESPQPVMWPAGSTARWSGSEIEVRGPSGETVTTGGKYEIAAPVGMPDLGQYDFPGTYADPRCMTRR